MLKVYIVMWATTENKPKKSSLKVIRDIMTKNFHLKEGRRSGTKNRWDGQQTRTRVFTQIPPRQ